MYRPVGRQRAGDHHSDGQRYGARSAYGYPISEEVVEDGRTVQYFERARLEWHPGAAWSHDDVLVGRLGAELLARPREVN